MSNLLEMADRCQHRQDSLDDHAAVPLATLADLEVGRMPVLLLKSFITEDHHLVGHAVNQVLESRSVVDIGCVTGPIDDQAEMIDQITQLAADDPARIGLAFLANLPLAEQRIIEILRAIGLNQKLIILDEPTSGLNESEVRSLIAIIMRLKSEGITILYISHRISEVLEISDRVTVLKDGNYVSTVKKEDVSEDELMRRLATRNSRPSQEAFHIPEEMMKPWIAFFQRPTPDELERRE